MSSIEERSLEDGRTWLRQRLERGIHPLDGLDPEAAAVAIEGLSGLDPEAWASCWGDVAEHFATEAARTVDTAARREAWLQAYRFSFVGRYPVPNHPAK
jgi:esterase FrsA